jgi:hypothetical protein
VVTLKLTWEMQDRLPATNRDSLAVPEKWGPGPFSNTFPIATTCVFQTLTQSDIATAPIQLALLSDATTSTVHHGGGVSGPGFTTPNLGRLLSTRFIP